jgi:hypothetical protein
MAITFRRAWLGTCHKNGSDLANPTVVSACEFRGSRREFRFDLPIRKLREASLSSSQSLRVVPCSGFGSVSITDSDPVWQSR